MHPDDVRAIVEQIARRLEMHARLSAHQVAARALRMAVEDVRALDPASLMGAGDGEAEALRDAVHLLGRVAATARGSLLLLARSAQLRATPSLINEAEGAAESLERALARLDAAKGGA